MRTMIDRFLSRPCGPAAARSASARAVAFALLGATTLATPLLAQGPPTTLGPQPTDSAQALMAEYQQVAQQLGELQVQAIRENDELEAHRSAIDEMVNAAMVEINPDAEAHMDRLNALSEEAMAAQQAQDRDAFQSLMTEAAGLRSELNAAMAEAVQREDLQAEIESFESELMARVIEIDPEAQGILARLEELSELLSLESPGE